MWAVIYRIEFDDDGPPEYRVLHRGTKSDCERVLQLVPAIAYSGDRHAVEARIGVFEIPEQLPTSEGGGL